MSAEGTKYDDHYVFTQLRDRMGFPEDAVHGTTKVQSGQVGGGKRSLPPTVAAMLKRRWRETMARRTGLKSYRELRARVGWDG